MATQEIGTVTCCHYTPGPLCDACVERYEAANRTLELELDRLRLQLAACAAAAAAAFDGHDPSQDVHVSDPAWSTSLSLVQTLAKRYVLARAPVLT